MLVCVSLVCVCSVGGSVWFCSRWFSLVMVGLKLCCVCSMMVFSRCVVGGVVGLFY